MNIRCKIGGNPTLLADNDERGAVLGKRGDERRPG